ncbi:hypothetical protein CW304_17675 [Bacillus sp. UFRGS-B20]|nr:hypothetical protein CW304_17675 [Bacillus sp. UFRGS-B20]
MTKPLLIKLKEFQFQLRAATKTAPPCHTATTGLILHYDFHEFSNLTLCFHSSLVYSIIFKNHLLHTI